MQLPATPSSSARDGSTGETPVPTAPVDTDAPTTDMAPTRSMRRLARGSLPVSFGALGSALTSLSRPTVVKGLVGLGLATSVAAAVAIPTQAATEQVQLAAPGSAALVARDRAAAADATTSRSAARSGADTRSAAVTAPAAGGAAVSAGPSGVAAVAKPKPKPKPAPSPEKTEKSEEKAQTSRESESTRSSSRSSSRTSTSSSSARSSSSGGSTAYVGWCSNKGLGANASKVCSAVRSNFGLTNIGGFRAGAGDHGTGQAVDVMLDPSTGDSVAQWAINNMATYDIAYVIWQQRIWLPGASGWRAMEDRGDPTQNHMDHVHISVE